MVTIIMIMDNYLLFYLGLSATVTTFAVLPTYQELLHGENGICPAVGSITAK